MFYAGQGERVREIFAEWLAFDIYAESKPTAQQPINFLHDIQSKMLDSEFETVFHSINEDSTLSRSLDPERGDGCVNSCYRRLVMDSIAFPMSANARPVKTIIKPGVSTHHHRPRAAA